MWKSWRAWAAGLLTAVVAIAAVSALASFQVPAEPNRPYVKISVEHGLGSGVYIGDGYFLTAAHVVPDDGAKIKAEDGSTLDAEVMWRNTVYDIALLHSDDVHGIGVAKLNCAAPLEGEEIVAFGNPMGVEFLSSSGRFVGTPRKIDGWTRAIWADISAAPGMSGGAVVDRYGEIVGITVGVMLVPLEYGFGNTSASLAGFTAVVPADVICKLLHRS